MSSSVSFGTNTNAKRKRVLYTGTDTIYEGMALCYDHDSTTNVLGVDRADNSTSTTTTEGSQNEGKFLRVEKPATNNLVFFAGVVAHGPKVGTTGTGATWLDVFIPNGAIVPVYTDNDCTLNETIMALENNSYKLTTPGWGRSVGVAMETVDRSSINGLCFAKIEPNMFIRQGTDNEPFRVADEEATCVMTNQIYVISAQTAGSMCLVDFQGVLEGTGDFGGGMFKFKGHLNAAASDLVQTVSIGLDIQANGEFDAAGGAADYVNCPLRLAVGTTGTPDLSNAGAASVLAAIGIGYHANESGGPPSRAYVMHFNSGATYQWDGLINTMNKGDLGDWAESSHITTSATGDRIIPVRFGGEAYHLIAYADDGK